ncbi:GNAT family N-acetyltransferase [Ancylobacter radicis]|uniref:GNAT family N-acetyltransferase n=1 Tax=Ancylobacter radicis TaxID=2836179 RepID=A0ABS5RBF3_9HYPH|nr:GNAT family N-acetyltransferase [Ancylobacter radicis]MBS9478442.1 GNAT family N-acetyltransferase [Ancylobacter radicis]
MEPTTYPTLNLDGYTPLPPGKLAAVVTFLEMTEPPALLPEPPGHDFTFAPVTDPQPDWYRDLFRRIGEEWLWYSRLRMDEAALRATLADPGVCVHVLRRAGETEDLGLIELDFRTPGEVELSYVGLVPGLVGGGAGRFMMNRALTLAFATAPRRVHVHTCTLDHQGAVGFYMRAGFRPYARAIEVVDDPRLDGVLSRSAGRHAPLIESD